jgi:hypothetical protein
MIILYAAIVVMATVGLYLLIDGWKQAVYERIEK